ncbi:MAG TPA: DUF1800 domain-containing protein [Bryobacteraceae bacterium]|nr:DUF1800 domain-containing protein [Bryobacteraceae bacterium]
MAAAFTAFNLCLFLGISAYARKNPAQRTAFRQPISKQEKIEQALNRLTFGPRPGDVELVQSMGLKKWIDQQLHPERIAENPLLDEKLRPLDSLVMNTADMLRSYPSPEMVREMVQGRLAFPDDPDKRMMVQRLAGRFEKKTGQDMQSGAEPLARILEPDELLAWKEGTPQQKYELFASLPRQRRDDLLLAVGQGARVQLYASAPPDLRRLIESADGPVAIIARDLADAKLLRAVYSNRQLAEVLADFWYNHFNVFLEKGPDRYLVTAYDRDAIRPHVLGKFEDLLRATAQSPAMLFYLDNWESAAPLSPAGKRRRIGLNENYARELMELHTLGVNGGYTQKDVTEVARCFTGWTVRQPQRAAEFEFNPRMHDYGAKTVLGVTIPAGGGIEDGYKVLDLLAHSPATAHHIAYELAVRFVADNPPPALVDRMAATFLKKDGDLRAVMKTMFDAPEFWSRGAYRSKVKSPFELVASSLRAVDANLDFMLAVNHQLAQLGEPLYRKLEPTGYSNAGGEWLNSAGLLARMNFSVALAANRIPGVKMPADSPDGVKLGAPEFQKK